MGAKHSTKRNKSNRKYKSLTRNSVSSCREVNDQEKVKAGAAKVVVDSNMAAKNIKSKRAQCKTSLAISYSEHDSDPVDERLCAHQQSPNFYIRRNAWHINLVDTRESKMPQPLDYVRSLSTPTSLET